MTGEPAGEGKDEEEEEEEGEEGEGLRARACVLAPSWTTAFTALLLVRTVSGLRSHVEDCDEVYNYWEPLHYLLHGYGKQTWENDAQFALRSWSYPGLFALLLKPVAGIFSLDKPQTFYLVRLTLAFLSAASQAFFYKCVVCGKSPVIGLYMLCLMLGSAGFWTASTALLPSSTAMVPLDLAFGYEMLLQRGLWPISSVRKRSASSIVCFLLASLFAWPFVAFLAGPFIVERLAVSRLPGSAWLKRQIKWALVALSFAATLLVPIVALDSVAYGRPVMVVWNIIKYNVLGKERGPGLYGTEPWHYYFLNMTLAFNLTFWLALSSGPLLLLSGWVGRPQTDMSSRQWIRMTPFYLWFALFSVQPHKEERFMYPIYTYLCFNAAVALDALNRCIRGLSVRCRKGTDGGRLGLGEVVVWSLLLVSAVISISRVLALDTSYQAPLQIYRRLGKEIDPGQSTRICVGKEWYRFPSSFFLPQASRLAFLQTDFDGCLPSDFQERREASGTLSPGWRTVIAGQRIRGTGRQNDLNKEEDDRYLAPERCDYLVDLLEQDTAPERVVLHTRQWTAVYCQPIISRRSHRLTRILWTPLFTKQNQFDQYCLLKRWER